MFAVSAIANRVQITVPSSILNLTNAQKLSLPANTPVGTSVQVTDGFVVSGAGSSGANGFYAPDGTTFNGEPRYKQVSGSNWIVLNVPTPPNESYWQLGNSNDASGSALYLADYDDAPPWTNPWEVIEGDPDAPTLTHPAVQQLAVPSTDEVAAFPSGAGSTAAISIYVFDSNEGQFFPLGVSPGEAQFAIFKSLGIGWILSGPDLGPGNYYYTADEGYDFPWQPPLWTAEDGTPPAPNMMAVTAGQLVTGWKLGSVVYKANGAQSGRIKFTDVLAVAPDLTWDGMKWTDGTTNGSGNTAFPDIGTPDPVASEANWEVIP